MSAYLPVGEIIIYVASYILLVAYGSWQLYHYSTAIYSPDENYFQVGWLLGRPQETDTEWTVWQTHFFKNWAWFVCQMALVEFVLRCEPIRRFGRHFNAVFGLLFVAYAYGIYIAAGFLLILAVFLSVLRMHNKACVWIFVLFVLAVLSVMRTSDIMDKLLKNHGEQIVWELFVTASWSCLRLLSAGLEVIREKERIGSKYVLPTMDIITYYLYVPIMFYGPILIFSRYVKMTFDQDRKEIQPLPVRLQQLATSVVRICVQIAAIEILAHMFYVNTLQTQVELCEKMPLTALYVYGFVLGTIFWLKYQITYGASMAIAQFGGMDTPSLPKFIGLVHVYSDMWKWFDRGLYEFLFTYIYTDLCARHSSIWRKLFASATTFGFIYIFHGTFDYVLVWSVLNYLCITIEVFGRLWYNSIGAQMLQSLSGYNRRRLLAIVGSQLFIPAVLSNFFFFTGLDIGWVFVRRSYLESDWLHYAALTLCSMCIFHTSEWVKRMEQRSSPRKYILVTRKL